MQKSEKQIAQRYRAQGAAFVTALVYFHLILQYLILNDGATLREAVPVSIALTFAVALSGLKRRYVILSAILMTATFAAKYLLGG